ncbi:MAG: FKBP-type peptidyl-prolyl cis-trans isomerase [Thermodesulfobacteriota bacterium]
MMKVLIAIFMCFALLSGEVLGQEKSPASDVNDKYSYSLGYQIGSDLKAQKVLIDPAIMAKGASDALGGQKPVLPPEEMRAVMTEVHKRIGERNRLQMEESAKKNLALGEQFLAENRTREGVKTLPSGLQYKVMKAGNGALPTASDKVTVQYRGFLLDGTEFDSSYSRNAPVSFPLDRTIPGWREALQLMKAGSKWQIFVPPALAYGERGAGPKIGPNSTLIFEVELVSVN